MTIDPCHEIRIDRACNAAICAEIGDRLRIESASRSERLPQHLMLLVDRLTADQRSAPAHAVAT